MTTISQKEYLKKYLAIGKVPGEKKKKKKVKTNPQSRVKIIDDDQYDPANTLPDEDPFSTHDDAPQIVAIIDERPPSLRVDEKTKNAMWQPIGAAADSVGSAEDKLLGSGFKIGGRNEDTGGSLVKSRERIFKKNVASTSSPASSSTKKGSEFSDNSPQIKTERWSSPLRDRKVANDLSPGRKRQNSDRSPLRGRNRPRDNSPGSPPIGSENQDGEDSPPKKTKSSHTTWKDNDDNSPPRKRDKARDCSPPRRARSKERQHGYHTSDDNSPPRRKDKDDDNSPPRKRKDSDDNSPPRNRNKARDSSPRRARSKERQPGNYVGSDDSSPSRRKDRDGDSSPPRRTKSNDRRKDDDDDNSPPRKNRRRNGSLSPKRRNQSSERGSSKRDRKSRWEDDDDSMRPPPSKMCKTLDGKTAGLQNAKQLVEETQKFRERENQLFKNMNEEISGRTAQTVVRDRKTGRVRNLQEEDQHKKEQQEREAKQKEKYDKWGKGLVQLENSQRRFQEEMLETSKPFARYAEDQDLERYLKEQEREGDPMLAYVRKKKRQQAVEEGRVERPQFEGEYMPNRYLIRPGHRWDGVDRSNGYEKKWFERQNARRALEEDTYKWSSEDM